MPRFQKHIKSLGLKISLLLLLGCIDPYKTPVSKDTVDALVVDGFINASDNSVSVKLSRAITLSSTTSYPPEKNAAVTIEGENGNVYTLVQKESGNYNLTSLGLDLSKKYRLHIRTADKQEYRSEYITLKQSPSLDNVSWKPSSEGITIYINAHDPSGKTRYYQWIFTETWEYNADYYSSYKLVNRQPVYVPPSEATYLCWKTDPSSKILIESTTRLSTDVVSDFPINFIPKGSKKIYRTYSINVQQRALDEDTYNYLLQLQKTTEKMGSLFDPMPSEVTGNIYNINDSSEPVLGYFRGGSVQEKRIFIKYQDLPNYLHSYAPTQCVIDSVLISQLSTLTSATQLLQPYYLSDPFPTGYLVTSTPCADCRLSGGGTLTKPTFWP